MLDTKIYAPVIIPTLCRAEHFKRCISSLSQCKYSDKTELIIGLDFPKEKKHEKGYKEICKYILNIKGFKKITIIRHTQNIGATANIQYLQEFAFEQNNRIILTEDDNEFSPCFLEYMNCALEYFNDNPRILSISGYTNEDLYNIIPYNIFPTIDVSGWGIGLWKNKSIIIKGNDYYKQAEKILFSSKQSLKLLSTYPAAFEMFIEMTKNKKTYGDVIQTVHNILNDTREIRPSISLVRNWGNDGTGENCKLINTHFIQQRILSDKDFNLDKIDLTCINEKNIKKKVFYNNLPKNFIKAWSHIIRIALKYINYRLFFSSKTCL